MERSDFDYQAFAKLRGKESKKAVNWAMLVSMILFMAGLFLLLSRNAWTGS
jgi:hypothetical protein